MPLPSFVTPARSRTGRLVSAAVALTVVSTASLLAPPSAAADTAVGPTSGSFTIRGAGWGHGFGMSQYGAYGAARQGLSWKAILAFYYPGTQLKPMPAGTSLRVWLTADNDSELRVLPAQGLRVSDASGHSLSLPTGADYTAWRVTRSGAGYRLSHRTAAGSYETFGTELSTSTWSFSSPSAAVRVQLPDGTRSYRGSVALVKRGSGARTVNTVLLEDYVRSVVPAEMPTSWAADAVRVQAVAARSYAVRLRDFSSYDGYDICDTTACQVYSGSRSETANGDAAGRATSGTILTYDGKVALTQFSSSNGGASAQSSMPYMVAGADPYDGVVASQAWSKKITAASVARHWPSVGTVKQLQVTSRDGSGSWGGRVRQIKIIGSAGSVTVSGSTFQWRYGMKSTLYTVAGASTGGGLPPAPAPVKVPKGKAYATFPRSYGSGSGTGVLMIKSGTLYRHPVAKGALGAPVSIGTGFGGYSHVAYAGDWNGDGYQDVASRTSSGTVRLHRGTATGKLAPGVTMGFGAGIRAMTGIGDATGDRHPDLAVITDTGNLWIYAGDGRTGRERRTKISSGWSKHDALRSPGDLTGDGRPDLITVSGDRLFLHRATATGFARQVSLGTGWAAHAAVAAAGDLTGDRHGDVLVRTSTGRLRVFVGDGAGRLRPGVTLPGSYAGTRFVL